jgi:hypothetical protein
VPERHQRPAVGGPRPSQERLGIGRHVLWCQRRGADNRLRRRDGAHSWPPNGASFPRASARWTRIPHVGKLTWRRPIGRRSRTRLGRLGQRPSTTTVHLFGATRKRMFDVHTLERHDARRRGLGPRRLSPSSAANGPSRNADAPYRARGSPLPTGARTYPPPTSAQSLRTSSKAGALSCSTEVAGCSTRRQLRLARREGRGPFGSEVPCPPL